MIDYITRKIKSKNKNKYNYEYFDKKNNKVKKKTINKFLTGIYIPPAYNNVKINKNKQSKVLAIGYDDKGRSQYTYNKKTINKNTKSKYKKPTLFFTIDFWHPSNIYRDPESGVFHLFLL